MPPGTGGNFTAAIKIDPTQANLNLQGVQKNLTKVGGAASKVRLILRAVVLTLGGLTGSIAFTLVVSQIAKFEQAMASLRAVTRATAREFDDLTAVTRRLGATTVFTASQAADAALFLGRAGFSSAEITQSLGNTLLLARAGGLELEQASDIAANTIRGFNLAATESGRVADVLATAASKANTTIQELGEGIKFVAPVAAALGVSLEETVAALGKISDAGLKGSIAGTGVRRILSNLASPNGANLKLLRQLNLDVRDLDVRARGLAPVIGSLAAAGVGAAEGLQLFGLRGGPAFLILRSLVPELEKLNDELLLSAGRAQEMAYIMDDTLTASLKSFVSAVSEAVLGVGDGGLKGALRFLADEATSVLSVWNNMTVEFASARNLSIAAANEMQSFARAVEFVAGAIGGLAAGIAAILSAQGLLGFGRYLLTLNPIVLALGAVTAAISGAFLAIKTEAEKFEESSNSIEASFKRIRDAAGQRNYDVGTLGGSVSGPREALEKYFLRRDLDIQRERAGQTGDRVSGEFGSLERSLSALGIGRQFGRHSRGAGGVRQSTERETELLKQIGDFIRTNREGVLSTGSNLLGYEAASETIINGLTELGDLIRTRGDFKPDSKDRASSAIEELLGEVEEGLEGLELISEGRRVLESFERDATKDPTKPTTPAELEPVLQALSKAKSIPAENAAAERQAAAENAEGIRARVAALTAAQLEEIFTFDESTVQAAIDAYTERAQKKLESIIDPPEKAEYEAFYKDQVKGFEEYLAGLPDAKRDIGTALRAGNLRAEADEANDNYRDLLEAVDGVKAAQRRLEEGRITLEDQRTLGNITETEKIDLYKQLEESLKDQLNPLDALLDKERESLQLAQLTNSELRTKQALLDAQAIQDANQGSITDAQVQRKAQELAQLREEVALIGARNSLRQELGIPDPNAGQSDRSKASASLFGTQSDDASQSIDDVIQAQERVRAGFDEDDSYIDRLRDSLVSNMDLISQHSADTAEIIGKSFGQAFDQVGNSVARIAVYGEDSKEVFRALGQQILASIISTLVQIGVQMLITAVLGKTLMAANTAAAVASSAAITTALGAQGAAVAAAWSPAALAVSLASFGANAAPAIAGINATAAALVAAQALSTGATAAGSAGAGAPATGTARFAEGGFVFGPGGPRDDKIPAMLSNGEFVINAGATKRNRGLLEAINASRYADGGVVGSAGGAGNGMNLNITVQNETREPVDVDARRDQLTGQIILTVKEALNEGLLDGDLEQFGANRVPQE